MNRKAVASRIGFLVGCRTSVTCILAMFGVIDPVSIEGLVRQGVGTLVVIFIIGICFAAAQGYERDQVGHCSNIETFGDLKISAATIINIPKHFNLRNLLNVILTAS